MKRLLPVIAGLLWCCDGSVRDFSACRNAEEKVLRCRPDNPYVRPQDGTLCERLVVAGHTGLIHAMRCAERHADCPPFNACLATDPEVDARFAGAIGAGNWAQLAALCRDVGPRHPAQAQCLQGYLELERVLVGERDAAEITNAELGCTRLGLLGRASGPAYERRAEATCAELRAAEAVSRALAAVRKARELGWTRQPFECGNALEALRRVDSDWARTALAEVREACEPKAERP
jgi:hypothetical protein